MFEYTYLLFWNSFWTIAPVVVMGIFDRPVGKCTSTPFLRITTLTRISLDDHVLMALPELYRHSRQGEYFNMRLFLIYMLDGFYQVCPVATSTVYNGS